MDNADKTSYWTGVKQVISIQVFISRSVGVSYAPSFSYLNCAMSPAELFPAPFFSSHRLRSSLFPAFSVSYGDV